MHEYRDHASGKSSKRPQFEAMFEAASRREFDVLLFWSLDRLSRRAVNHPISRVAIRSG